MQFSVRYNLPLDLEALMLKSIYTASSISFALLLLTEFLTPPTALSETSVV